LNNVPVLDARQASARWRGSQLSNCGDNPQQTLGPPVFALSARQLCRKTLNCVTVVSRPAAMCNAIGGRMWKKRNRLLQRPEPQFLQSASQLF
jgi:hypothetical protein